MISSIRDFRLSKISPRKREFFREYVLSFGFYILLSVGLTWPLLRFFTRSITGADDALQFLWMLWHTKQALFTSEPMFYSRFLYYPLGTTLLTNAAGPVMGIFALPFWFLGPEAAYNGSLIIGFGLTGTCMYLFARTLGFKPAASLFAGTLFMVFPMHLVAIDGHLSKIFLGGIPLTLLAFHKALDLMRGRRWIILTAFAVLITLLTSGEQFVFTILALCFWAGYRFIVSKPGQRWQLTQRIVLTAAACLIFASWYIVKAYQISEDPGIVAVTSAQSFEHQPDLVQFFSPNYSSLFWATVYKQFTSRYDTSPVETSVFILYTGLILGMIGFLKNKAARSWLLFALFCILFAIGPDLKILGNHYPLHTTHFPYNLLVNLPGLGFMRTPGRFMFIGAIGVAVSACFGLEWIQQKFPIKKRLLVTAIAIGLVLFEVWPKPWPQTVLRPVPDFYKQIAQDHEQYGVFDLPIRPAKKVGYFSSFDIYSSYYQLYQMTHGKGIASGYVGRRYVKHPLFSQFLSNSPNISAKQPNIFVNGNPANRYAGVRYELASHGYRYVVFHKPDEFYPGYQPGSWGELAAKKFIKNVFGEQSPFVDDDLVTVYEVGTLTDTAKLDSVSIVPMKTLQDDYVESVQNELWMTSPASFYLASPQFEKATLEINISYIGFTCPIKFSNHTRINLQTEEEVLSADITVSETVKFPISVGPGSQVITMKFEDRDDPSIHTDCFKFLINFINLQISSSPLSAKH